MSATPYPEYPDELRLSVWDKKKGSLPAGAEVADKLKALQKKHDAVDWKQFDAGWPKTAKTAADLEQAFALRDRLYRGSVFALKKDALGVASAAKSLEKGAAKPVLDAARAIGKAANGYADDIDKGIDELKSTFEKAQGALPKDDEEDEDSAPNLLLDPKRLLKQLKLCRTDPERTMNFAFIDGKGKEQLPVLALHPKMSSRKLFSTLQTATGVKTGAFGSAWVDGNSLMLQLDKPLGGLVKKVRGPVKACGFKIAKAVLWNEDGTVFEEDASPEEAVGSDPAAPVAEPNKGAAPPAPPKPSATYEAKLAALQPRIDRAAAEGGPDVPKHQKLLDFATTKARAEDFLGAVAALRQIEQLLDNPSPKTTASGGVDPAAAFNARFAALLPKLKTAPLETKAIASEAGIIAKNQKHYDKAGKMLDEVERRLAEGTASTAAPVPGATTAPAADEPMTRGTQQAPPMNPALAFRSRLTGMVSRMKPVEAAGGPVAAQMKAKRDEAVELARQKAVTPEQMAQAMALLDEIEELLGGDDTPEKPGSLRAGAAPGSKPAVSLVTFAKLRLDWEAAKKNVTSELATLRSSVEAEMAGDPMLKHLSRLSEVLAAFNAGLGDALDDLANSDSPAKRRQAAEIAGAATTRYLDHVVNDSLIDHVELNPFVPVALSGHLLPPLSAISAALGKIAA